MKRLTHMMLASALAGACAFGATWIDSAGAEKGLLEHPGNWDGAPSMSAIFGLDTDTDLRTEDGFTSGQVTLTASNCIVMIDVPGGETWNSTSHVNFKTIPYVDDPSAWNLIHLFGGGTLKANNDIMLGHDTEQWGNKLLLSGEGTTISGDYVYVGGNGHYNTLVISNGANVGAMRNVVIGGNTTPLVTDGTGSYNATFVTGTNSVLRYAMTQPGHVYVGLKGDGNSLVLEDGGACTNQSSITYSALYIGTGVGGNHNGVIVRGEGSAISNFQSITVGGTGNFSYLTASNKATVTPWTSITTGTGGGKGNRITLTDGGLVATGDVFLGSHDDADGDTIVMDGKDTLLTTRQSFQIGVKGENHRLAVSNQAVVAVGTSFSIGGGGTSDVGANNTATVTGTNTVLRYAVTGAGYIYVGQRGAGNSLVFEKGGACTNVPSITYSSLTIGNGVGGDFNSVVVRDEGSAVTSPRDIHVGNAGSFNSLTLSNKAFIVAGLLATGQAGGKSNNVLITDGSYGLFTDVYIGNNANSGSDTVVVNGKAKTNTLVASQYLFVGAYGGNHTLLASNGASLIAGREMRIGCFGSSNVVNLSGATLELYNHWSGSLNPGIRVGGSSAGYEGECSDNGLILNDALLFIGSTAGRMPFLSIGESTNAFRNYVTLEKSTFTNGRDLIVGVYGSDNWLSVGPKSEFNNALSMTLGQQSSAKRNTLDIWGGGTVTNGGAITIGNDVGSFGNTLRIRGNGSELRGAVNQLVYVGKDGSSNLLEISDGGKMTACNNMFIGSTATASNNMVEVRNGTLLFQNNSTSVGSLVTFDYAATLKVAGTNALVSNFGLNPGGIGNGTISLLGGSKLHVELDDNSFPEPFEGFVQTKTLVVTEPVTLKIDAKKLGLKGGVKAFPIISLTSDASKTALEALADPLNLDPTSTGKFTVYVSDDDKQLLINVASEAATMILLR